MQTEEALAAGVHPARGVLAVEDARLGVPRGAPISALATRARSSACVAAAFAVVGTFAFASSRLGIRAHS